MGRANGGKVSYPPLTKLPRDGRLYVYPPAFEGAFAALPPRHVAHPKADAYTAWRARLADVEEVFQLEAAALAYAEECEATGTADTKLVMMASTFFGPGERWAPYLGHEPGDVAAAVSTSNGRGGRPTDYDPTDTGWGA